MEKTNMFRGQLAYHANYKAKVNFFFSKNTKEMGGKHTSKKEINKIGYLFSTSIVFTRKFIREFRKIMGNR